jgi:hypothetical protein
LIVWSKECGSQIETGADEARGRVVCARQQGAGGRGCAEDNHSAHISQETRTWLAAQPKRRFAFVFTPKHGSWLNLIEGFFSKAARSVLRHIRVNSKHELKQRIIEFINDLNRDPVDGATKSISLPNP